MRIAIAASLMFATLAAPPVAAQAPVSPERQLATLLRQDAGLRERIGQIQLDALVSQVDRTFGHKPRGAARPATGNELQRQLDLYTY